MIIDLTRRPLFVNTDICLHSIVLRTGASSTPPFVDGIPRRDFGAKKKKAQELKPEATKKFPSGVTLQEMRLPVTHRAKGGISLTIDGKTIWKNDGKTIVGEPFYVRTQCTDVLTKLSTIWEVKITVEEVENKNGSLWIVSVFDVEREMCLVALTAKGIGESVFPDVLPLTLLSEEGKKQRPSAWDRLKGLEGIAGLGDDIFPDE